MQAAIRWPASPCMQVHGRWRHRLREALEQIAMNYDDVNTAHRDYRVDTYMTARAALGDQP